jgi:hypothetical protein
MSLQFLIPTKAPYDISTINYCIRELSLHEPLGKVMGINVAPPKLGRPVYVITVTNPHGTARYNINNFLKHYLVPIYARKYIEQHTTASFNRPEIVHRTVCLTILAIEEAIKQSKCPYRILEVLIRANLNRPLIKDINSVFERKTLNKA